jgi:hydroxymethylpyrimidine pyrophosphatase-like HAD family hydrolase
MGAEAVEVGPVGADKGNGLRWLCTHLDIDLAGVVVFGDEVNDLAMFAAAGTSVAVANAHPTVLDACDVVTSSNADDGVAAFIEELLATG